MAAEKRQHPRYTTTDLMAAVKAGLPDIPITLHGKVVDISFDGLKIKLDGPKTGSLESHLVKVDLFLPNAKTPISVNCALKHTSEEGEIGVQFVNCSDEEALDDYMFECMKLGQIVNSSGS